MLTDAAQEIAYCLCVGEKVRDLRVRDVLTGDGDIVVNVYILYLVGDSTEEFFPEFLLPHDVVLKFRSLSLNLMEDQKNNRTVWTLSGRRKNKERFTAIEV